MAAQATDYRMKRYVANRNRMVGGMVMTVQRQRTRPCPSRFANLAFVCLDDGLQTDRYGLEAVSPR